MTLKKVAERHAKRWKDGDVWIVYRNGGEFFTKRAKTRGRCPNKYLLTQTINIEDRKEDYKFYGWLTAPITESGLAS
jgi:hypothetical protein